MRLGIYAAALGSIEQEKRLEIIGNNLANVNTPGFKKEEVRFTDFLYEETKTHMEQGSIKVTNNPLDVAIVGEGFFKVQTKDGTFYTRAGNFTLNSEGQLVLPNGSLVLGRNGTIKIDPSKEILIDERGRIVQNGSVVDQLEVVKFDKSVSLEKVGNNLFKPSKQDAKEERVENATIRQNCLEEPNFNLLEEMTKMIDTLRVFESYQRTLQTIHEQDRQLIRRTSPR